MKKEIKILLKELLDVSNFMELDKLKQKEFQSTSTYQEIGESKIKIREKRYLNGQIVYEKSYKRVEDDCLSFHNKIHFFDYSQENTIVEKITEAHDVNEDYITRRFDESGNLIFEQNSSNYDEPGYEKRFFYEGDPNQLTKIEQWYHGYIKSFEINLHWKNEYLKSIERVHFKANDRYSKEYLFMDYNDFGKVEKVYLEFQGLTGKINFKYSGEELTEKYKVFNYFGIKPGKAIEYTLYDPTKGIKEIITAEYYNQEFVKGMKFLLQEKILSTEINENNGQMEKQTVVKIDTKWEIIKNENDLPKFN